MSDVTYQDPAPAPQEPGLGVYQPNQRAEGVPPEGLRFKVWPKTDQEWKFDGNIQSAPEWVDKGWASFDGGPALAVPVGDPAKQPYTTTSCRKGDTLKYKARKNGAFGEFIIEKALIDDTVENPGTKRPAQESGASLEDMLKTGAMAPSDLDADAAAQVRVRNPLDAHTILPPEEGTPPAAA